MIADNGERLRFRVWDEVERRYGLSPHIYNIYSNKGSFVLCPPASDINDRFVIEQSTGKLDCRGNLIFEGDVLYGVDEAGYEWFFSVRWFDGNMVLFDFDGILRAVIWDSSNYEIIGNVHEPPKKEKEKWQNR